MRNSIPGPVDVSRFLTVIPGLCFDSLTVVGDLPGDDSCTRQPDTLTDGQVCAEGYTMDGGEVLNIEVLAELRTDVAPGTICPNQAEVDDGWSISRSEVLLAQVQDCSPGVPNVATTMTLSPTEGLQEGDSLTVSIVIANLSVDTADTAIQLTQELSPGVSNLVMTSPPPVGTWVWDDTIPPNGQLTYLLDQLEPGQAVGFEYTVDIDLTCLIDAHTWCSQAFTSSSWIDSNDPGPRGSDSGDGLPAEPTCSARIRAMGHTMVSTTKSITTPPPQSPGDPVTYRIVFENSGPCTAPNGTLRDDIPAELTNFDPVGGVTIDPPGPDNISSGPGSGANGEGLVNVVHLDVPGNGGKVAITVSAEAKDVPPCTAICNAGQWLFPWRTFFTDTNTVCQDVAASLDIAAAKSYQAPHDPVLKDDVVSYAIRLTNNGSPCDSPVGELIDDIPAGVAFDLASAQIQIVSDPGGKAVNVSPDPPAGAHGNGQVRIANIEIPDGATFELAYQVRADTAAGPPGICNQGFFTVSGPPFATTEVCYEVEPGDVDPPDTITGVRLTRKEYDVHVEGWDPDPNAASYSVYLVRSDPIDKTRILNANADGMSAHPDDIERLCQEVPSPSPSCVHADGVSVSPSCIFYQVVGVASDGLEGPN